jgi:hypothetical protein
LAYSYTKEEQEINPETADLELSEFQQSAVDLMEAALNLANRTIRNENLFNVSNTVVESTSQPPPPRTITKFRTPDTKTTVKTPVVKKPTVKPPIKVKTKAPKGELSNTVENDSGPTYNIIGDTNARQVDENDENTAASTKSNSENHQLKSVTLWTLFLSTILVIAR